MQTCTVKANFTIKMDTDKEILVHHNITTPYSETKLFHGLLKGIEKQMKRYLYIITNNNNSLL